MSDAKEFLAALEVELGASNALPAGFLFTRTPT